MLNDDIRRSIWIDGLSHQAKLRLKAIEETMNNLNLLNHFQSCDHNPKHIMCSFVHRMHSLHLLDRDSVQMNDDDENE